MEMSQGVRSESIVELSTRAVKERLIRLLSKQGRKLEIMDKSEGVYLVRSKSGGIEYANTLKRIVEREGVLKAYERY